MARLLLDDSLACSLILSIFFFRHSLYFAVFRYSLSASATLALTSGLWLYSFL